MKKTISCLLAILMLTALVGCGAKEKIAEKAAEEFIEGIGGGNVDIDGDKFTIEGEDGGSITAGDNLPWPGDKMGDLPKPKATIAAVLNDDGEQQCTVTYEGMEKDDAEAYVEKLKALGYTGGMELSDADMIMTGGLNENGDAAEFIYNFSAKEGFISYTHQAQQPQTDGAQGDPASGDAEPQPSSPDQATELDIVVALPDGWKPVEGSVLEHQYMKNTAGFMIKTENFSGDTLDDVVSEALDIFGRQFDNFAVQGDVEDITISGLEAKKLTFTCEVSKMEMKYTSVYLFAEDETYALTFGDLADSFDSLAADYEAILNGIQFKQ
ncbi:hypothetical protein HZF24_04715 [Sedimentibacter hydroxybenzoicus DSM 7310]|uniref:DUF4340 domain-containing protein n=1 Tax=Sedimentibacter hydroxybenzoicus DSM 7310 TaxID=1123245 RepID=A0A974BIF1_SEDHY|nr:hypothetical protein [Sedimentibacter hydroxybenzoicus]NYB73436.1 hypothetical protein [Sedimentibacter hydroxybenzoicus DSM 7310]